MLGRLQRPPRKGEAAGSAVCVGGGGAGKSPPLPLRRSRAGLFVLVAPREEELPTQGPAWLLPCAQLFLCYSQSREGMTALLEAQSQISGEGVGAWNCIWRVNIQPDPWHHRGRFCSPLSSLAQTGLFLSSLSHNHSSYNPPQGGKRDEASTLWPSAATTNAPCAWYPSDSINLNVPRPHPT